MYAVEDIFLTQLDYRRGTSLIIYVPAVYRYYTH